MTTEQYAIGYEEGHQVGFNEGADAGFKAATTRQEAKIKELVEALEQLEAAYCEDDMSTRDARHRGRMALIKARAALTQQEVGINGLTYDETSETASVMGLTEQSAQEQYPLPDSLYPGSKDWQAGSYKERVEWLHLMYESAKQEIARLEAQQEQPASVDAYVGAREDAAIWKKRALEAEELNRKFIAELNGPTYLGEPVKQEQPAQEHGGRESLESLLSTAIGTIMSCKDRIGYKENSVVDKFVKECAERLKDWPGTATTQPAQEPDPVLCKFYQVTTFAELVSAQEHHINKLQEKQKKEIDNGMGSILVRKSRAASDEWSGCTVVGGTVSEPQTVQVITQPALSEARWNYINSRAVAMSAAKYEALCSLLHIEVDATYDLGEAVDKAIEAHCRGGAK